ncbi:MAG: IS4 family transposase [Acidobacteriia bacterium]|nr:IS4 family transposase [Terriglobia bacterium]
MNSGKTVFSQLMDFLPLHLFRRCVRKYRGNHRVRSFSCLDQLLCMAFAQLTYRESLRDIEACQRAVSSRCYHMGIRGNVARNTLAHANETRDWRIYADFAQILINIARPLYAHDDFGLQLDETVYALDSSTIELCLSMFPWARYQKQKGAIRLHTLLDLRGPIPACIWVSDGKFGDVTILDSLIAEPGAFYIMDRGYIDFARLHALHESQAFFVVRARDNMQFRRIYSHPVDRTTGLRCDQTIVLTGIHSPRYYPDKLRRIRYVDVENERNIVTLTNNFMLPAQVIAQLYKCRWQIELFFKWIKQHLRIKAFYGTSENAVKTQIWIAVSVYVLVAIVKKRLQLDQSLYTILQILSLTCFEKTPIYQILTDSSHEPPNSDSGNQLALFNF